MTTQELTDLRDAITAQLEGRPWQIANGSRLEWYEDSEKPIHWYIERSYLVRAKPQPRTVPWSAPEHVPLMCFIRDRRSNVGMSLIVAIGRTGFQVPSDGVRLVTIKWGAVADYEYSTDRITWRKCEVEVTP